MISSAAVISWGVAVESSRMSPGAASSVKLIVSGSMFFLVVAHELDQRVVVVAGEFRCAIA